jgi:membrane protease YdiL (CAAX protease family)
VVRELGIERRCVHGCSPPQPFGMELRIRRWGRASSLLALVAALVAYGNVASLARAEMPASGGWPGVAIGLVPVAAILVLARRAGVLTALDLGLTRRGAARSIRIGLMAALAPTLPALLVVRFPLIMEHPVTYAPLDSLSFQALLWRACLWMPLDTALPEEIAFRGVLLAVLRRRWAAPWATVLSAVPFTLWHGVIVTRTIALTNLQADPRLVIVGLAGAFAAVFVGGILFAALRLATGHLAGSIVAHWAFNAALLAGLYAV